MTVSARASHSDVDRCPGAEELRRLRLAIRASGEIMFMTDPEGIFTHVNPEFTRVYGYEPSQVVGRTTPRILKSGTTSRGDYDAFWRLLRQRQVVRREFLNKAKDGTLLHIEGSVSPIVDDADSVIGFLAVQRDVTEARRLEKALDDTARHYQTLANAAADAIFIVNRSEEIQYANAAAAVLCGVEATTIIGKRITEVFPPDVAAEMWRELTAVFSSGTRQLFEHRFELPTGEVWLEAWLAPIVRPGEPCQSVMGIARNITERKLLERQFMQAQKMEAVGRLAGGIAHDFNNLLTAILGYADLAQQRLRNAPDILADVEEITKAGEQAGRLTRHLLAFTRNQVMTPQLVDISAIVADAKNMVQRVVGEDIRLSVSFEEATQPVMADPGRIEQVLLNLVVNARDAMPTGGPLLITTANVELDETAARRYPDGKCGRFVRLAVEDAGCGMTADVLAHVFEPFFTTKPSGKGTGLGLSTVYGIVKQSGGWIAVDSVAGRGTTISTFWPIDNGTGALADQPGKPLESALRGSETILLVEDEPGIRNLIRRTLESRGYQVLDACDVTAAVAISDSYHGTIDMLLTDIIMPVMNGPDVAQRIIRQRPDIKVLYVSGYPHTLRLDQRRSSGRLSFLAKPFTPTALATIVRECFDKSGMQIGRAPMGVSEPARDSPNGVRTGACDLQNHHCR